MAQRGVVLATVLAAIAAALPGGGCSRPAVGAAPSAFGAKTGPDEIERQYPRGADEAWDAVVEAFRKDPAAISQMERDALGGDLIAKRSRGGAFFVRVRKLEAKQSSVNVRLEPPDRAASLQFHESIARGLGLGEAGGGLFGGASEEGSYRLTFEQSVQVAEEVFRALSLEVTDRKRQTREAEWKGRRSDSTPVKIRVKSPDGRSSAVTFSAGVEKSDDAKALANALKREFESRARLLTP